MKIIKKQDITNLVESTMKQAGLLKEDETLSMEMAYMDDEMGTEEEPVMEEDKPDFLDLDKDGDKEESMKKAAEDKEEMEESEMDVVSESVNRLASEASKHNVISEGLKKELDKFNKITNYKY